MTNSRVAFAFALGLTTVACAGYAAKVAYYKQPWMDELPASADERSAADKAKATGTKFTVAKDQGSDAWGRAQTFVTKYAGLKMTTATDFVVQTADPYDYGMFGYDISRTPQGDGYDIEVKCKAGQYIRATMGGSYKDSQTGEIKHVSANDSHITDSQMAKAASDCATNAAIAGHFIKTGEMLCERCIATSVAPHKPQ